MNRWRLLRILAGAVFVLALVGSIGAAIFSLQLRYGTKPQTGYNIYWVASQFTDEYLDALRAIERYTAGGEISHAEMQVPFEIFLSRVDVLETGHYELARALPAWQVLKPKLHQALSRLDTVIQNPGFPETAEGRAAVRAFADLDGGVQLFRQRAIREVWQHNVAEDRDLVLRVATMLAVALTLVLVLLGATALLFRRQGRLVRSERAAKEIAQDAGRARDRFLASMSHELRTPLNAIIGFSDIMRQQYLGALDQRYVGYAQDINRSGRHLLGLVDQVLDLSKIMEGKIEVNEGRHELKSILEDCARLMGPLVGEKAIALETDFPVDAMVRIDQGLLAQVLINLLSNAVKFTPEQGRVDFGLRETDGVSLEIYVRDSGIGMSEAELSRVFEPFYQVQDTYARSQGGTGLGLPLAQRLSQAIGIELEMRSALGEGTEATLRIPGEKIVDGAEDDARRAVA